MQQLSNASRTNELTKFGDHDIASLSNRLRSKGYAKTPRPLLAPRACRRVRERMPKLFRGEFETGVFPDEWHWREGISRPDAAREMCNSWKSDRVIASIVLSEEVGRLAAEVAGWESVRIAQDDLIWKPPSAAGPGGRRIDTVGFHQDSAYISSQFEPYENNSLTLWVALDDADEENGCVEYAAGSHEWRPIPHRGDGEAERQDPEFHADAIKPGDDEISSFHSADETSYMDGMSLAASLAGVSDPIGAVEPAPAREGFAILHDQDAWHGSGPNRSRTRHRRALVGHYVRGDATFRVPSHRGAGPFGRASYIYGRYKRYDSIELDESFFPVIYGRNRTIWVDDYLNG